MRRLWSDIDQARDNLGLGPTPPAEAWSMLGFVGAAAGLARDAAGAVTGGATGAVRGVLRALPDPFGALGGAASCVRRLPIVGSLFED